MNPINMNHPVNPGPPHQPPMPMSMSMPAAIPSHVAAAAAAATAAAAAAATAPGATPSSAPPASIGPAGNPAANAAGNLGAAGAGAVGAGAGAGGAGATGAGAPPPSSSSRPEVPSPSRRTAQLNTYIYDYFLMKGYHQSARALLEDKAFPLNVDSKLNQYDESCAPSMNPDEPVPIPDDLPRTGNTDDSAHSTFLFDWFNLFMDIFVAQRSRNRATDAAQYLQHTQVGLHMFTGFC